MSLFTFSIKLMAKDNFVNTNQLEYEINTNDLKCIHRI